MVVYSMMKQRESLMKKRVTGFAIGLIALAFSASPASAALPYVSGSVSVASLADSGRSYDSGNKFGGAVGFEGSIYRVEAEFGNQKNGVKNSSKDVSMSTYMANCYCDIKPPLSSIKPFVTAGVGFANVDEHSGAGVTVSDRVVAWQVGAGVAYNLFPAVNLDLQYRHFGAADAVLAGAVKYGIASNHLLLGLRVGF
jgi:opacity protein-like surface antigen